MSFSIILLDLRYRFADFMKRIRRASFFFAITFHYLIIINFDITKCFIWTILEMLGEII